MPIIETEADLLRLLDENEEFLTLVRSKILTDELLRLPARVDDIDARLAALIEHATETDRKIAALTEQVAELTKQVAELTDKFAEYAKTTDRRLDGIDNRLNGLRGDVLENKLPASLLQRLAADLKLRRLRPVWLARGNALTRGRAYEYESRAENAVDEGTITDEEETRLLVTDMVVRALRVEDDSVVYVAVEASGVINAHDISRARRSADILRRLYDTDAIPAVYGYGIAPEQTMQTEADEGAGRERVHIFLETGS